MSEYTIDVSAGAYRVICGLVAETDQIDADFVTAEDEVWHEVRRAFPAPGYHDLPPDEDGCPTAVQAVPWWTCPSIRAAGAEGEGMSKRYGYLKASLEEAASDVSIADRAVERGDMHGAANLLDAARRRLPEAMDDLASAARFARDMANGPRTGAQRRLARESVHSAINAANACVGDTLHSCPTGIRT